MLKLIPEFYQIMAMAVLVGLLTGLERSHQKRKVAGIRFFTLIALVNSFAAFLAVKTDTVVFPIFTLTITAVYAVLLIVAKKFKGNFVTGLAVIYMGLVGAFIGYGYIIYGLGAGVLLPMILILKDEFNKLSRYKTGKEMKAALRLLILAALFLPLLPNRAIDPWGLVNPFFLLLIIIAIASLQFLVFLAAKKWQSKGIIIAGALAGFIDSNIINGAMSSISKKNPELASPAADAVVAGNLSMVLRNFILIIPFSSAALIYAGFPSLAMLGVGVFIIYRSFKRTQQIGKIEININPFEIKTAIRFVFFTVVIAAFAFVARGLIGNTGIYLAVLLGSLVGDVPVLAAAIMMAVGGVITNSQMVVMIMINSFVSSLNDGLLQYLCGAKALAKQFYKKAIPIVLVGIVVLVIEFLLF